MHSGRFDRVSNLCKAGGVEIVDTGGGIIEFSRNGEYLLVNSGFTIAKITLATGQTTKILDTQFPRLHMAWWFGDDIAVSIQDSRPEGRTSPVRLISSEGAAIRTLPVHGEIIAADGNGRFLLVLADPDDPSRPMPRESLPTKAHLLAVSAEGGKLRDMGAWPRTDSGSDCEIVVSPGGTYVAFTVLRSRNEADAGKTATRVVSMADGRARRVLAGKPIAVTDKGELLTSGTNAATSNSKGASEFGTSWVFTASSVGGKEEVLFGGDPKVIAATIADGRLYYLHRLANGNLGISWAKFR